MYCYVLAQSWETWLAPDNKPINLKNLSYQSIDDYRKEFYI